MASTLTNLLYHIVFSTKDREPLIREGFRAELEKYTAGIIRNERGILLGIGGMPDHLHLITKFKPDRSVADMVRLIKANSSKWVNENHGERGRFAWQSGYGAFFREPITAQGAQGVRGEPAGAPPHSIGSRRAPRVFNQARCRV